MEISSEVLDNVAKINITGKMVNYGQYEYLKSIISELPRSTTLLFYFYSCSSIDSHILGYILKLKEFDNRDIEIIVENLKLYEFLLRIDFNKFFTIKINK